MMQKRTRLAMIVLAALFLMGQSSVPGVLVLDGTTVKGRATTLVCGDNLACSFAGGTDNWHQAQLAMVSFWISISSVS